MDENQPQGDTLSDQPQPDPVSPELAPFVAKANSQVAAAIDGLHPADVIRHLETTVAQAQIEASRLGISFEQPVAEAEQLQVPGPDGGPVVVIRRLVEDDPS